MEQKEVFLDKKTEAYVPSRKTWNRPLESLLNIIGFSIGLGNVWRFPYLCHKNGGGAFLIPYFIVAVLCGFPLLFQEVALGQLTKRGGIGAWNIVPIMKGAGFAGCIMTLYYMGYIVVVMSWVLFYFAHSFTSGPLPWSVCDNVWNTDSCRPAIVSNNTKHNFSVSSLNVTSNNTTTSTEEFWTNYVLRKTEGIHDIGTFTNWRMMICFVIAWIMCILCVWNGIRTSGKVVYVTVTAPYIMMTILLIRGVTLEGAGIGILYYIRPEMKKLLDPQVWLAGGGQILYSLAVGFSMLYGMGSYNESHTNCYRHAYICVITGCATSIYVGFVIYSFIGHMAFTQGVNITEVANGGPGLVFEVFPAGISLLPLPQLWSAIFFVTLIFFSIDSVFGSIEGCLASLEDIKPEWFARPGEKVCRVALCSISILIGIPMLFDGGIYIFELFNMYGNSGICIFFVALCEVIALAWIYGIDKFFDNVKSMIGYYPPVLFKYCYLYVTPLITLIILIACCAAYSPLTLGGYVYPVWGNVIGWIIASPALLAIPIVAAKTLLENRGSFKERWKYATTSRVVIVLENEHDDKETTSNV